MSIEPKHHNPPRLASKWLRFYCKPRLLEVIEGDIHELFYKRIETEGLSRAKRQFYVDVVRFFRLKYVKGLEDINSKNNIPMFKNHLKVTVRSLLKHKFYSFINITGLSFGLAACLLIAIYVKHEFSYDQYHQDAEQIYRIANNQNGRHTPARLGIQAKMDFPEIEEIFRIYTSPSQTFNANNRIFKEDGGYHADSTIHKVLSIDFLEGKPDDALTAPNSVVLTKTLAEKYFPNQSAYGQLIKLDGVVTKVTGVVADPPKNTHLTYSYLHSLAHSTRNTVGDWTGNGFFTYAKLSKGADVQALEARFPGFKRKHAGADMLKWTEFATYDELLANSSNIPTFTLKPLTDLHLYYPGFAFGSGGDINKVYTFSAVAFFILLIACINFMNLSTARAATRFKEVGMRKVLGSRRSNLINQFLVESLAITLLATVLAVVISAVFLPAFNAMAHRSFELSNLLSPSMIPCLLGLVIVVGLAAGSYPALYLSAFKPIKVLKGGVKASARTSLFRKGLVTFQFSLSILLIISTLVIHGQLRFMSNQKLGFEADEVMVIKNGRRLGERLQAFSNELRTNANIETVSMSSNYLSAGVADYGYQTVEDNPRNASINNIFVSGDFLNANGLEMVEGRFFSESQVSDTMSIVINEATAKWLGWDEVIGRQLSREEGRNFTIIGVMKDFNYASLKQDIQPMILRNFPSSGWINENWQWWGAHYLSLKVNGDIANAVEHAEQTWARMMPEEPFDYTFVDESFAQLYEEERRFGRLFSASSGLAIIIACLGLFALAAFTLERRFKEIAIRKVLGATVSSLSMLILSDFTKLVFIGAVIAIPAGYFIMNQWLANFAYQLSLGPVYFMIPAAIVAVIAWLTVGFQSVKTALGNPVKALRSE